MALKADLPLYHHKERAKFSRRKHSSNSRRRNRGPECWWVVVLALLLFVVFFLGVLLGFEFGSPDQRGEGGDIPFVGNVNLACGQEMVDNGGSIRGRS